MRGIVLEEGVSKIWRDIKLKENLLYLKSRARWIREGDANTKYFHSLMKHKRRSNLLLLDEIGKFIEDVDEVKLRVKNQIEKCFEEARQECPMIGGIEFKQISNDNKALL